MKKTLKEYVTEVGPGVLTGLAAGAVFTGSIAASELSGLTQCFVDFEKIMNDVYLKMHQISPLLVFSPPTPMPDYVYRIRTDLNVGITSIIAAFFGTYALKEPREEKRNQIQPNVIRQNEQNQF